MDNHCNNSLSVEPQLPANLPAVYEEKRTADENGNESTFVNHAAIAWHEQRRQWIVHQSKKQHRTPKEPIISWCTTYDDLLSNNQPFPQPIPLTEMVDFLVDIWHEEGLYD